MRVQLYSPKGQDLGSHLPWETPLEDWPDALCLDLPRGISRNLVRFTVLANRILALKQLPDWVARREYHMLRNLREANLPSVEPVALITERGAQAPFGLLVTQFMEYSLPYRTLFSQLGNDPDKLLDSMVQLLVRLHLGGLYWGDCSLSNVLFVRDAGAYAAYLVDAETAELHERVSDGMRAYDLEQAEQNIAGELLDLQASNKLPSQIDPLATAEAFAARYERLWQELNRDEIFARDETYRIAARVKSLNELGFTVEEIELCTCDGGHRVQMRPRVVEHGFHRRRLHSLTGLEAEENQSRELLNDLHRFQASLSRDGATPPLSLVAYRWLTEVYQATIGRVPESLRQRLSGPELFHQLLEHRWLLSEAACRDIGTDLALQSYQDQVLSRLPMPLSLPS